jgi:hypothetical protein
LRGRSVLVLDNMVASAGKEKIMADDMTNEQFDKFIKLIITIANDSDSKEEFIEKIEALIKNN